MYQGSHWNVALYVFAQEEQEEREVGADEFQCKIDVTLHSAFGYAHLGCDVFYRQACLTAEDECFFLPLGKHFDQSVDS